MHGIMFNSFFRRFSQGINFHFHRKVKMNLKTFSQLCVSEQLCEMRWQNTRLPSFDKVQFWHWHPAAHSHFPSRRCLFKCVTKVSSWYVAMFAAVDREPALPHCVTALAGPITTFKLHNTVDSHGSHCGIVCFSMNLWWKIYSGFSSVLHPFIVRKVFTRVKVIPCRH